MAVIDADILTTSSHSIAKEIDVVAQGMILDNLQAGQYRYPIKSFVREVASNCLDSIKERDYAVDILEGKLNANEVYEKWDGNPLTKDSQFDPSYYNLKYLSTDPDVHIKYIDTFGNRDKFSIKDYGVGLGGSRLQGYLKLGYSTKRLTNKALGSFGLGAKAGLATGVDSYTLISTYNGRKYVLEIYSRTWESSISKYSEDGTVNPYEVWTLSNGEEVKIHYEPTEELNSVEVLIDVKNPEKNKSSYLTAVKSQLLYFSNIKFGQGYPTEEGNIPTEYLKSKILYEDDRLIVAEDSGYYNKPHIVINGVVYSVIDWSEMEMNTKYGAFGIKVRPDEVSVPPNRESVIYDSKTAATLNRVLKEIQDKAASIVLEYYNIDEVKNLKNFVLTSHMLKYSSRGLAGRLSSFVKYSTPTLSYTVGNTTYDSSDVAENMSLVILDEGSGGTVTSRTEWYNVPKESVMYYSSEPLTQLQKVWLYQKYRENVVVLVSPIRLVDDSIIELPTEGLCLEDDIYAETYYEQLAKNKAVVAKKSMSRAAFFKEFSTFAYYKIIACVRVSIEVPYDTLTTEGNLVWCSLKELAEVYEFYDTIRAPYEIIGVPKALQKYIPDNIVHYSKTLHKVEGNKLILDDCLRYYITNLTYSKTYRAHIDALVYIGSKYSMLTPYVNILKAQVKGECTQELIDVVLHESLKGVITEADVGSPALLLYSDVCTEYIEGYTDLYSRARKQQLFELISYKLGYTIEEAYRLACTEKGLEPDELIINTF